MAEDSKQTIRFLTCGSVDDGKSTLIGHILYKTDNLYQDQIETLKAESGKIGNAGDRLDFSLLMDGLLAEREQGITIDVAYRYFDTASRKFIVADTPGHEQYTRNMATAASVCDAAVILIDARLGVLAQSRRHTLICALMGIRSILFAVNKMDLCDWKEETFRAIEVQCSSIVDDLAHLTIPAPAWQCVPVSALLGENLVEPSSEMPWFEGKTVLKWLETLEPGKAVSADMRLPIQYVVKPGLNRERWQKSALASFSPENSENYRLYAGKLFSGSVAVGDRIVVLPSGTETTINSIIESGKPVETGHEGRSVGVTLADKIDASRGDGIFHPATRPQISDQYKARIVWMQDDKLHAGRTYMYQTVYGTVSVQVVKILNRIDMESFHPCATEELGKNDLGDVELMLSKPLPFDEFEKNRNCGSFLLIDKVGNGTAAAGIILHSLRRADNVHWQAITINKAQRARALGQKPGLVWLTGLSGSGKSTIANALERELWQRGNHTMLLDGDNVRHGLCKDLGFTEADRIENIRRIGEVAKLMVDAGLIVITSFISPYREDRHLVRDLFPEGEFIEVFVDTPLKECERRDPKGLYRKAREGIIPNFTGVNAPYEEPENPEVRLTTIGTTPEDCAREIVRWLEKR